MKEVCSTTIDACIWDIESKLASVYGCMEAERMIQPLVWYINTGRASTDFLRLLINAKPQTKAAIYRRLAKLESFDGTITAICNVLHLDAKSVIA